MLKHATECGAAAAGAPELKAWAASPPGQHAKEFTGMLKDARLL